MATGRRRKPWADVEPVRLSDLTDEDGSRLRAGGMFDAVRFRQLDLSGRELSDVTFSECELADVMASDAQWRGSAFVESHLDRLDAAVFRAARSRFRDVRIRDSRFGSAELYETAWDSVLISGCKLGFVNLRTSKLSNVVFEDCVIEELDLSGAVGTRLTFRGTRIDSLEVTNARLDATDLRGAGLRRIVGIESLRGTTMSASQLADLSGVFADHLGIEVDG